MQKKVFSTIPPLKENILSLFHEIQNKDWKNHISPEAVRDIAGYLDLSVPQVYGVLSFYHMFSHRPRGSYVIRLCDSLSCRVMGSLDIYEYLVEELGIREEGVSEDGLFSIELVNCLGSCDTAPNMMVNDSLVTNLTVEKVREYLDALRLDASRKEAMK
jgi:NADH:ubiquinone oxidoreductase subunit E